MYQLKNEFEFFCAFIRDITDRKKAEEQQSLSKAIINSSNDAIISKTLDGIITSWNLGAEKIFGYAENEAVGKPITIIIPADLMHEEPYIVEKIRRGESVLPYETERIKKDGSRISISMAVSPVLDSNSNIVGASKIARDITPRKKAEKKLAESENFLRTIIQTEPHCVKLLGISGALESINASGLEMIEAESLHQVRGKSILKVINKPYRKAFKHLIQNVFIGKSGTLEFEITGLKGTHRWLETHSVPLRNAEGKILSLLGISLDVTVRKKQKKNCDKSIKSFAVFHRICKTFVKKNGYKLHAIYMMTLARNLRD